MIEILIASENDIAVIEDIFTDVVSWLDSIGKTLWRSDQVRWERLSKDYSPSDFCIAYMDGLPAGCMALTDFDPQFWADIPKGESLFIHKLAVKRTAAGKGVSDSLIGYAKDQCAGRGIGTLRLDCDLKNEKVCALYERHGFARVSESILYGKYRVAFYVCEIRG